MKSLLAEKIKIMLIKNKKRKVMKKIIVVLIVLCSVIGVANSQESKTSWYEELILSGEVRTGSGYAPLFGAKLSDDWSLYYMLDVQHKSGFGVGAYRMTDFNSTGMGKVAFFDAYWSGNLSKNVSIYAAMEYGFFDNVREFDFLCPYVMVFWDAKVVNVTLAPMYNYYLKTSPHEFIVKGQISREIIKGTTVEISGWYHSELEKNFFGSVGVNQQLPKGFYLQVDYLRKSGENNFLAGVGYKF